jgi:hypothetical protein
VNLILVPTIPILEAHIEPAENISFHRNVLNRNFV